MAMALEGARTRAVRTRAVGTRAVERGERFAGTSRISTRRGVVLGLLAGTHVVVLHPAGAGGEGVLGFDKIFKCTPGAKCVSTASFNQPSQYSSPWIVPGGKSLREAAEDLSRAVEEVGGRESTTLSAPFERQDGAVGVSASSKGWGEDMRFLLKKDAEKNTILVTYSIASPNSGAKVPVPDPPGCLEAGCITGPPQRRYVEAIRNILGWLPLETDEDKKWVQIMAPFLINPDDYVSTDSATGLTTAGTTS
ncbi:hypothetical protein HOP50_01g09720 [Chloropicon primus]|uniref:Uncharacterized protein n=2 Tax=Chloropicon primus TaxID=1764295 RepID=A0A5B8MD21_9CHLO|nr:hypothetical protein A3770_01p09860 [Chloropicon primus]UPQ97677.1 hypothetical protein HOP50_01g09720 [Chloropicon primus]|eukprot:QDZ18468.1 hypothetical protein A3770_01p09860 [Chloropicon primus]